MRFKCLVVFSLCHCLWPSYRCCIRHKSADNSDEWEKDVVTPLSQTYIRHNESKKIYQNSWIGWHSHTHTLRSTTLQLNKPAATHLGCTEHLSAQRKFVLVLLMWRWWLFICRCNQPQFILCAPHSTFGAFDLIWFARFCFAVRLIRLPYVHLNYNSRWTDSGIIKSAQMQAFPMQPFIHPSIGLWWCFGLSMFVLGLLYLSSRRTYMHADDKLKLKIAKDEAKRSVDATPKDNVLFIVTLH